MRNSRGSAPRRSKRSATTCGAAILASIDEAEHRDPLITAMDLPELRSAQRAWQAPAHTPQLPPSDDWSTWLFLGGRGAGKTRAGAEWLTASAAETAGGRFALVGPSLHDVREVMVEGPSGLRATAPADARPTYESSRRRLLWPNGAVAHAFSAEDPESLRGPQFHAAWADEFCAWRRPSEVLAMLRLGLRLGARPRLAVTTTPKPIAARRSLMAEGACVQTRAATASNAAHLAPTFLRELEALYGGTRLAAQELDGLVTEADEGALWRAADLARARGAAPVRYEAVVVAVDPPASSTGDACGIVAVGREGRRAYVLADRSAAGLSPLGWAARPGRALRAGPGGARPGLPGAGRGDDGVRRRRGRPEPRPRRRPRLGGHRPDARP